MVIHDTAVWSLIVACAGCGLLYTSVLQRRRIRDAPHEAPLFRLANWLDAAMLGIGTGMAVACGIVAVAAVLIRLGA